MKLAEAAALIAAAPHESDMLAPLTSATGVIGASVSTLVDPFGAETLCATYSQAAAFSERQLDLGVGPAWDALRTTEPVFIPELRSTAPDRWPGALEALINTGVETVWAFPMHAGGLDIGAVTLHPRPGHLPTPSESDDARSLAETTARRVLQLALQRADADVADIPAGPFSRHDVHHATGMIAAQLTVSVTDAMLVLRARAYATRRSVRDIAARIVARDEDIALWNQPGSGE